ncbi:MAG: acyltransferase domain-containing protein [Planctomycetota bacterium]|jgi:hypothetical protein
MSDMQKVTVELIEKFELPNDAEVFTPEIFSKSEACFEGADNIFSPEKIAANCDKINMGDETKKALIDCAKLILADDILKRYASHLYFLEFDYGKENLITPSKWQSVPESYEEPAQLLTSVAMIAGVDNVFAFNQSRGIADDITINTLSDIELWAVQLKGSSGRWQPGPIQWHTNHYRNKIYRLGRLQFDFSEVSDALYYQAFENTKDNRIVMLAAAGFQFRSDGQVYNCNGIIDPDPWTTVYTETDDCFEGNPINPKGFAEKRLVKLAKSEWRQILKIGDKTLGLHIPASGRMSHEDCGKSIAQAIEFFPKHFPEFDFKAITSASWLFDAQFEDYLKPDSNIVMFLKEFYLVPCINASDKQTMERVFGGPVDIETAPQESSVQRAIIEHMKKGSHMRMTSALYFPQKYGWGENIYRAEYSA